MESEKTHCFIFLTEGVTPRRGRRVLPVTLGHHYMAFGSARTARALNALDLAGALHALWRTERRGAREKGVDQDRRTNGERYATGPTSTCVSGLACPLS